MAQGSNTNRNRPVPKKADVILQREKRILANQADILNQIDSALDHIESVKKEGVNTARQRSAIYEALTEDVLSVKQDIKFLAAQAESIFLNVSAQMQKVMKEMEEQLSKIRNTVPVQQVVAAPAEPADGDSEPAAPQVFNYTVPSYEPDYDKLSSAVVEKIMEALPVQEIANMVASRISVPAPVYQAGENAQPVTVAVDYDKIADIVTEKMANMPAPELDLETDLIAARISEQIVVPQPAAQPSVMPVAAAVPVQTEIDYDKIAQKVAEVIPVQESISADYIASKVSEQIVIPAPVAAPAAAPVYEAPAYGAPVQEEMDYEALSDMIAEKVMVAEKLAAAQPQAQQPVYTAPVYTAPVYQTPSEESVNSEIDYDKLADAVAQRVAASLPAQEIVSADYIASKVSEQIVIPSYQASSQAAPVYTSPVYSAPSVAAIDYDALAEKVASRIRIPQAAATEAVVTAAPEWDYDDIADRVVERVVENLPAVGVAMRIAEAMPAETIASKISDKISAPAQEVEIDTDAIAEKISDKIVVPAPVYQPAEGESLPVTIDVDYDRIAATVADRVIENLPAQEETAAVDAVSEQSEPAALEIEIDYDKLAEEVANRVIESLPARAETAATDGTYNEQTEPAVLDVDYDRIAEIVSETLEEKLASVPAPEVELDTDGIAEKISDKIVVPAPVYQPAEGESLPVTIDVDYDRIAATVADRVIENLPAQEETAAVDAVSEQSEPAALEIEIDYDKLAEEVANRVIESLPARAEAAATDGTYNEQTEPAVFDVDYDRIAEIVSETLEEKLASVPAPEVELDTDGIAEKVSEKISVTAPAYTETAERASGANYEIDYDAIAQKVAEKLPAAGNNIFAAAAIPAGKLDIDEEELADRLALKLGALKAQDFDIMVDDDGCASISKEIEQRLDYDAIAAKVAEAVRASFMDMEVGGAEIDYDEMTARLSEALTSQTVDEDSIADKAAAAISNYLPEVDYEKIANKVSEQLSTTSAAPDAEEIADKVVNQMMNTMPAVDEDSITQKVVLGVADSVYGRTDGRFDTVDKGIEEIKSMLTGGIAVKIEDEEGEPPTGEEPLLTVSELVEDEGGTPNPPEDNAAVGVAVAHTDEVDEESAEEGLNELIEAEMGGVDFLNMMKFNRSFIARIIQSSDEQKRYYGSIKNRFLSYAKVNSNVSWKNERIYKGRETIARFRIIGKTLCLYLALDPELYPSSVYHQKDVSDNQSMAGTPMMVKVMSDRGLKKALRLVDELLEKRGGIRRNTAERDYAKMYPYETIDELIEDGLVKDMRKGEE